MKTVLLTVSTFLCSLLPLPVLAQGWQWALGSTYSSGGIEDVTQSVIDRRDNIYSTLLTNYTTSAVFGTDSVINPDGGVSLIVFKTTPSGHFSWERLITGGSPTFVGMGVDSASNVYIYAQYGEGVITIGSVTLTNSTPSSMAFIAKFDSSGNVVFAQNVAAVSPPTFYANYGGMDVDAAGNIYIFSTFSEPVTIGATTLACPYMNSFLVAKFSNSGAPLWARGFYGGENASNQGCNLRVSPRGNIYVEGIFFCPSVTFDSVTLSPASSFLVKLDTGGHAIWARTLAFGYSVTPQRMATDSFDNVYFAGGFRDTVAFAGDTLFSPGIQSALVAKIDSSGSLSWAVAKGDSGQDDQAFGVGIDPCNNVWVCGAKNFMLFPINDSLSDTLFISQISPAGVILSTMYLPGGGDDWSDILFDHGGNFYIGADYDLGPYTIAGRVLPRGNTESAFIAKYQYFKPGATSVQQDSIACVPGPYLLAAPPGYASYLWSDGSTSQIDTVSGAGTYFVRGSTSNCLGTDIITDTFHIAYIYPSDTGYVRHDTTLCPGAATLQLPAGWTTYYWSTGATGISTTIDSGGVYWGICTSPCTSQPVQIDTFFVAIRHIVPDTESRASDTLLCPAFQISLSAPGGFSTYLWSNGSSTRSNTITLPGVYWVYCTPACPDSVVLADTFRVAAYPADLPFSLGPDTFACSAVVLHAPGGGPSYTWQDGATGGAYTATQSGTYYCTAYEQGCSYTDSVTVTIPAIAQHLRDTSICEELFKGVSITANVPFGATCIWSTGSTGQEIMLDAPGAYWVTVTAGICTASDTMTLATDKCGIVIHDVITPNGDGVNDTWVIEGIGKYPGNSVEVFDKWGTSVFLAHDYNNTWQGRGTAGDLPDGTYYYLIKTGANNLSSGEKNVFSGALLIKR